MSPCLSHFHNNNNIMTILYSLYRNHVQSVYGNNKIQQTKKPIKSDYRRTECGLVEEISLQCHTRSGALLNDVSELHSCCFVENVPELINSRNGDCKIGYIKKMIEQVAEINGVCHSLPTNHQHLKDHQYFLSSVMTHNYLKFS